jgi:hypothetical protein
MAKDVRRFRVADGFVMYVDRSRTEFDRDGHGNLAV